MKNTIKIEGKEYKIRYTYQREDGTEWIVTDANGELQGEFGDEWPARNIIKI